MPLTVGVGGPAERRSKYSRLSKQWSMVKNLRERFRAGGVHLLASAAVASLVAVLVFGLWYPDDYRYMAGGSELLVLIMSVDVVLGPLLTFAVFNRQKGWAHLRRDIVTIAVLQLSALAYGIYTVSMARPVALVFEFDRFRVITSAEVVTSELSEALPEFRHLSLLGPITLALRRPESGDERSNALATAIFDGVDTSQRPKFWIPYGASERVLAVEAGRPLEQLIQQYPDAGLDTEKLLKKQNLDPRAMKFLPVRAKNDAVAVVQADGRIVGFLPYDGYF
jgi:hypothetical protein